MLISSHFYSFDVTQNRECWDEAEVDRAKRARKAPGMIYTREDTCVSKGLNKMIIAGEISHSGRTVHWEMIEKHFSLVM